MNSTIITGGLHGMESYLARVEVDCSKGLPAFDMVGLLGSEVKEARERIRVALRNADMQLPPMRITVNISPASLHKQGTFYDLPVAAGILAAQGLVPEEYVKDVLIAGELGLGGEIRPIRGILPMVLEARKQGLIRCVIPKENVPEARLVPDIRLDGIERLEELTEILCHGSGAAALSEGSGPGARASDGSLSGQPGEEIGVSAGGSSDKELRIQNGLEICETGSRSSDMPDFREIQGQEEAKRAAVAAAAGFHHMLLIGPPGTGKTMIARCLPSILPPLSEEEQLEVASIYSVAGKMRAWKRDRPFVSPHHTMSSYALTGGGQIPRPGAISLAHRGVLFLDELTEFRRSTLDLLRQPLEEHQVSIARISGIYSYPADFMLVAAMNPCPCGYYPDRSRCRCTPAEVKRYLGRVSGPILDRIDICTEVNRVPFEGLMHKKEGGYGKDSAMLRAQVMGARERQERRFAGERISHNAQMNPENIRRYCPLGISEERYLEQLFESLQLSARACHRLIRVARTLADLDGRDEIGKIHLSEAACYRMTDGKYWG